MTKNISWNTTKTTNGFDFRVYEIVSRSEPNEQGHYADLVTLRTGSAPSRAVAKNQAQKWVRYLKATH